MVEERYLIKNESWEWLQMYLTCLIILMFFLLSFFRNGIISWFSALLLQVHATHLPIIQKLIKIILQLCYQLVCFVFFLIRYTFWLWSSVLVLFCFHLELCKLENVSTMLVCFIRSMLELIKYLILTSLIHAVNFPLGKTIFKNQHNLFIVLDCQCFLWHTSCYWGFFLWIHCIRNSCFLLVLKTQFVPKKK